MNDIAEHLDESSDFRLDETDGKYFPYERYPSSKLNSGFTLETYCHRYQIFTGAYEPSQKWQEKETSGNIDIIEPKDPENSNFRRDILLWVVHHPRNRANHVIKFVVDQNSQNHGNGEIIGPHINPRPEDEQKMEKCEECNRLFEWLDHYELTFEQKENYKEIDFDSTVSQIKERLLNSKFTEDYELKY